MTTGRRLAGAIAQRIRGPYRALGQLDARLAEVQSRLVHTEELLAQAAGELAGLQARSDQLLGVTTSTEELLAGEIRGALRAVVSEESANRRQLTSLRAHPEYETPWQQKRPLVTVTVATRDRAELLSTRSLPSILAQTYTELEVIVVGDHADDATAEAVAAIGDQRLVYRNLTQKIRFTDDPWRHWLVGCTMARNEAMRIATGQWVMCFDDDDFMRPDCVERLLAFAREQRLEAAYGRTQFHGADYSSDPVGTFPPQLGKFTWAAAMYHGGLRFFERELYAADLTLPGDWFLARRMLRAGVRFGMTDAVLADIYPSPTGATRWIEGYGADDAPRRGADLSPTRNSSSSAPPRES